MALSYAPFGAEVAPRPPSYIPTPPPVPTSDNTECNYVVMFFVAGVIVMGIMDSLRR
jgi:hypothetical protein